MVLSQFLSFSISSPLVELGIGLILFTQALLCIWLARYSITAYKPSKFHFYAISWNLEAPKLEQGIREYLFSNSRGSLSPAVTLCETTKKKKVSIIL